MLSIMMVNAYTGAAVRLTRAEINGEKVLITEVKKDMYSGKVDTRTITHANIIKVGRGFKNKGFDQIF